MLSRTICSVSTLSAGRPAGRSVIFPRSAVGRRRHFPLRRLQSLCDLISARSEPVPRKRGVARHLAALVLCQRARGRHASDGSEQGEQLHSAVSLGAPHDAPKIERALRRVVRVIRSSVHVARCN